MATPETDIALAEFQALRAEIVGRQAAQASLVGICLTGVGVAFGLVLSKKGVPEQLLLVVPFVVTGLGLFYAYHNRAMLLIGEYIRCELWPRLASACDRDHLVSWEEHVLGYRRGSMFATTWKRLRYMGLELLGGAAIFLMPGIVALVAFGPSQALRRSTLAFVGWLLGAAAMVLLVGVSTLLAHDHATGGAEPAGPADVPVER